MGILIDDVIEPIIGILFLLLGMLVMQLSNMLISDDLKGIATIEFAILIDFILIIVLKMFLIIRDKLTKLKTNNILHIAIFRNKMGDIFLGMNGKYCKVYNIDSIDIPMEDMPEKCSIETAIEVYLEPCNFDNQMQYYSVMPRKEEYDEID